MPIILTLRKYWQGARTHKTVRGVFMKLSRSILICIITIAARAEAGDVVRQIVVEADPVAPASAAFEQSVHHVSASQYGGLVDFNMGAKFSTGPELWTGTFVVRGDDSGAAVRREDLWAGERHKIDAVRFRWTFGTWEQAQSMRGWFFKGSYNWTRINSRANRFTEDMHTGAGFSALNVADNPNDETDLITDMRHGVSAAFGNRWMITDKLIASVGASLTHNFRRIMTVDSKDPMARADYESLINTTIPDSRMSTRPTPEANLGLGYAW
jgi:hypothetical protein